MINRIQSKLTPKASIKLLCRLVELLDCSLARYLSHSRPWKRRPYMLLDALTRRLNYEHESFAMSIAQLIDARRGTIRPCVFPAEFTYYNEVSLEYLAPRLLEHQRLLIVSAEKCAAELAHDPEAQGLVNQLVTSLQKYEKLLVEILAPQVLAVPPASEDRDKSILRNTASSFSQKRYREDSSEPQSAA